MDYHSDLQDIMLLRKIRSKLLQLAANKRLKIYGKLSCMQGKRMKRENRIFFSDEAEALQAGFRPCAHCVREAYLTWKQSKKRVDDATPHSDI